MPKPFATYQYLEGTEMTDRDSKEIGSKFWNKGKWDNFVAPLLPEDCRGLSLIEVGCNAGLFLKFAEEKGFDPVIGVDSDEGAVKRGLAWRDRNGGKYQMMLEPMETCLDKLPLTDYTVLVNTHYYFTVNDWFDYLDRLQYKTRYCIIVTADGKQKQHCWASNEVADIRRYFKVWQEVGFVDEIPFGDDPMPRRMWGLCFKSPFLDREETDKIVSPNKLQEGFYAELDEGVKYDETNYFKALKEYRRRWSERRIRRWLLERIKVFEDIKKNGLKRPLIVNLDNLILDGNHRYEVLRHLGFNSIFVRRT